MTDHSSNQNGTSNDQLSIGKELSLGAACNVNNSYFCSTMLKNGNFDPSFNICSTTPYQPGKFTNKLDQLYTSISSFDNKPMNQPRVYHSYTNMTSDEARDTNMNGMFYGTWDLNATIDDVGRISDIVTA